MTLIDFLISPFSDYAFMRRALTACCLLALGGTPLGMFLMLRRMTLVGEAMSHAILPGVAIAFLVGGLSLWSLTLGGFFAAILMAFLANFLTHVTKLKEDSTFSFLYLISLALGITLLTIKGTNIDLLHLLFGNILALDQNVLWLIAGSSSLSLLGMAIFYRRFIIGCFDPDFLKAHSKGYDWSAAAFMILLMINLVTAFQALGTLMALGLMILPPLACRFWTSNIDVLIPLSVLIAIISSYGGLLLSFYSETPTGPAIILVAGSITGLSILGGRFNSVLRYIQESKRS